ncbi:hypothetical protein UlMin_042916 [Ulmus minor]
MRRVDGLKASIAMIVLQCITAAVTLYSKAALAQGMKPMVFVVYRQTAATIIMAPLACFARWKNPQKTSLGLKSFSLIFFTSLIGATANNNTYFVGLNLSSSTVATAMLNLIPAITFVMAAVVGLEKINIRSLRSNAKIIGTIVCISGGICMALLKGPDLELLNAQFVASKSIITGTLGAENLSLGCLFLFINCCCNSFWIVMQVSISKACPDHLYATFWLIFFSSIQSAICTWLIYHKLEAWALHSLLELSSCLFAAIGEAVSYFIQVWCISETGPVFSVMFTPLCTVITAIISVVFLHENLYVGSLVGAFAVIIGLYVVLWGKAEDLEQINQNRSSNLQHDDQGESLDKRSCTMDLEEPLLPDNNSS